MKKNIFFHCLFFFIVPSAFFAQNLSSNGFYLQQSGTDCGTVVQVNAFAPTPARVWHWSAAGATPAFSNEQNPSFSYSSSGTFAITLVIKRDTNAQIPADTFTQHTVVMLHDTTTKAFFSWAKNGLKVHFVPLSDHATTSWSFGNGKKSTDFSPLHTFDGIGNYSVKLVVNNGCKTDSMTQIVQVDSTTSAVLPCTPPTNANFSITQKNPLTATFLADTSVKKPNLNYHWRFNDKSFSHITTPTHTFPRPQEYEVCLTVSNLCGMQTACKKTLQSAKPKAAFANVSLVQCDTATLQLSEKCDHAKNLQWTISNRTKTILTTTKQALNLPFNRSDTLQVRLIALNEYGSDTATQQIILSIPTKPLAAFRADTIGTGSMAGNRVVAFQNNSTGATSFKWNFGDQTPTVTDANPRHTYAKSGMYEVQLEAANTCGKHTQTQTISVIITSTNDRKRGNTMALMVYPNPNNGEFTLRVAGNMNSSIPLQWTITDGVGRFVSGGLTQLNNNVLEQLIKLPIEKPSGQYLLEIKTPQGEKIVKAFFVQGK